MFEIYVDNELLATFNHYSDAWEGLKHFMKTFPQSELRLVTIVKPK